MAGSFGLEEKHLYLLLQGQYYFTEGKFKSFNSLFHSVFIQYVGNMHCRELCFFAARFLRT